MNGATARAAAPYLKLTGICKYFGVTQALENMDLEITLGEILGLVGPNGAGKSTLIKVITGTHEPSRGEVRFRDSTRPESVFNANMARTHGVACAYQELSLLSNLTVYENFMITLMDHKPFAKPGWRRRARVIARVQLDNVFPGHGIDVNVEVSGLFLAQRQMIEVAKAVSHRG